MLTEMKPAYDLTQRRNFGMPRRTFQVLTLNGITTVAVNDDGALKCLRFLVTSN